MGTHLGMCRVMGTHYAMNSTESGYVQSLLDSIAYPSSRMSFSLKLEFHTSFCK